MLSTWALLDGFVRFQSENVSDPAAVHGAQDVY